MASTDETRENGAETCTIEATVPTGFESVAAAEAKEMLNTECRSSRGKITFETPTERVKDVSWGVDLVLVVGTLQTTTCARPGKAAT